MNSFEYAAPNSLPEAVSLLAPAWGETEILAGGTDLVTSLKQGIVAPKRVVSLKNLAQLRGVDVTSDRVRIGGATPLIEVLDQAEVVEEFPCLTGPIEGIGSRQVIAKGTIAGDLCQRPRCWYFRNGYGLLGRYEGESLIPNGENRYHAIFGNDGPAYFVSPSRLAPGLIALDATLVVQGPDGERTIACGEFFRTPTTDDEREYNLQPNEIVTFVDIPRKGLKNAAYEVQQRQGLDWPYVAAAAALKYEGNRASDARVVLGHVAPVPWPVPEAAKTLNGKALDDESLAACAQAAVDGAKPLSDNGYKVAQVRVAVKRALLAAIA
jgi:xanthine dehydrogenase YagS FAD-binding subunit